MKLLGYVDDVEHQIEVEPVEGGYLVTVDGQHHEIDFARLESSFYSLIVAGRSYEVSVTEEGRDGYAVRHGGYRRLVRIVDPLAAVGGARVHASGKAEVRAIMPGRVTKILVDEGQDVAENQGLIVLEAMKMENELGAPRAGRISQLLIKPGQTVESGELIAVIE